jgi:transglutaminase-like putative cysteine protease
MTFEKYLASSAYIDWNEPILRAQALFLAEGCLTTEDVARSCFLFVRDRIQHSWDYRKNPVTCKASDVLKYSTGYCYAKSHLLAALLRANHIPAGLCYQRLTVTGVPPYCLHGLNSVYLPAYGWYRLDARGNKTGVLAEFSPPSERLAFTPVDPGEKDLPGIWHEPHTAVVKLLTTCNTVEEVYVSLPDVEYAEGIID